MKKPPKKKGDRFPGERIISTLGACQLKGKKGLAKREKKKKQIKGEVKVTETTIKIKRNENIRGGGSTWGLQRSFVEEGAFLSKGGGPVKSRRRGLFFFETGPLGKRKEGNKR